MRCDSCPKGLRALVSRKLGACPTCIRTSVIGAIVCWVALVAMYSVWRNPSTLVVLLAAVGLTVLAIIHTVAFTARLRDYEERTGLGRRAFLAALLKGATTVALVSLFGDTVLPAHAQQAPTSVERVRVPGNKITLKRGYVFERGKGNEFLILTAGTGGVARRRVGAFTANCYCCPKAGGDCTSGGCNHVTTPDSVSCKESTCTGTCFMFTESPGLLDRLRKQGILY